MTTSWIYRGTGLWEFIALSNGGWPTTLGYVDAKFNESGDALFLPSWWVLTDRAKVRYGEPKGDLASAQREVLTMTEHHTAVLSGGR